MNLEENFFEYDMERLSNETEEYNKYFPEEEANITEWRETTVEEQLEANLDLYKSLVELQNLGEDVTEAMEVANAEFNNNLAKLETKPGVSKETINNYLNRRGSIITTYLGADSRKTL